MVNLNKEIVREKIVKKEMEDLKVYERTMKVTALEFTFDGDKMNQTG